MNLRALRTLLPASEFAAIEINARAAAKLREWGGAEVFEGSILDLSLPRRFDLALIKGVLFHIYSVRLHDVYDQLESCAERFIVIAE